MKGNKKNFIEMVDFYIKTANIECPNDFKEGMEYFENIKNSSSSGGVTEKGKMVLNVMTTDFMSAEDIGIKANMAPKSVSGTLRKLVSDGFVEKEEKEKKMYYKLIK